MVNNGPTGLGIPVAVNQPAPEIVKEGLLLKRGLTLFCLNY